MSMFDSFNLRKHLIIAMKDNPSQDRGLQIINSNEIFKYNDKKYGIFLTVQGFKSDKRTADNLAEVYAWAIDMDESSTISYLKRAFSGNSLSSVQDIQKFCSSIAAFSESLLYSFGNMKRGVELCNTGDTDLLRNAVCLDDNLLVASSCNLKSKDFSSNVFQCVQKIYKPLSFVRDCPACHRFYDELFQKMKAPSQDVFPLQDDVLFYIYEELCRQSDNRCECGNRLSKSDVLCLFLICSYFLFGPLSLKYGISKAQISKSKREQKERIQSSPLTPSNIVETKSGYHCYWMAKDADIIHFKEIQERLVHSFGADIRAKDLCRILRMPCCFHWKDPSNPFLVDEVFKNKKKYTENQMLTAFPAIVKRKEYKPREYSEELDGNAMEQLEALSGHPALNGEQFTFKHNTNGTYQICVNGESTSSWIDKAGNIGSHAKGGPSIAQWVKYYGYSYGDVEEIIKKTKGE